MKKLLFLIGFSFSLLTANGQAWVAVGTGLNNGVWVMDSALGKLYVGGFFSTAGGKSASRIASWDGANWASLGSGLSSYPFAIIEYNSKLIVAGNFDSAGGVPVGYIAAWDGSSWSSLAGGMNGAVGGLAIYNGNLYASGSFTKAGGISANNIAMWNGAVWSAVGKGLNNGAGALAVYDSELYVFGSFDSAGNIPAIYAARWNGAVWDSLGGIYKFGSGGCVYRGFNNATVYQGELFVGGTYMLPSNNGLSVWNGKKWDTTKLGAFYWGIDAATVYQGVYFAGGTPGGPNHTDIAYWNGTKWDSVGNGILPCSPITSCAGCAGGEYIVEVSAIAGYNGHIYAGGAFSTGYGNVTNNIEEYTGIVGINELHANNLQLKVFPNPSNGVYSVELKNKSEKLKVEVYGVLGQEVYSNEFITHNSSLIIDLSGQPAGIYFLRVITDAGVATQKLVLQK